MQFILFLFSYAVNPLLLYFLPTQISVQFLQMFTLSNILFSLTFTYLFSKIQAVKNPQNLLKYVFYIAITCCLLTYFKNPVNVVAILYPFSLLYSDYAVTQSEREKKSVAYRMFLMLSGLLVVAIVFIYEAYFLEALLIRSILILIYGYYEVNKSKNYSNLKIEHATSFLINTYVFYSGALLFLVYINDVGSTGTKHWYIALQLALGLILKLLDFSVRKNSETNKFIMAFVFGSACITVCIAMYLHASSVNFAIAFCAIIGLMRLLVNLKHE